MPVWLIVVLGVLGMAVIQACVWIPILAFLRKQRAARAAALQSELDACASSGERVLCGPTFARVRNGIYSARSMIALTEKRVIVQSAGRSEIPLAEVASVETASVFNSEIRAGYKYVVLHMNGRNVGLQIATGEHERWFEAIQRVIGKGGQGAVRAG